MMRLMSSYLSEGELGYKERFEVSGKKIGTRYKTALTPAARYNYNEKNFYSSLHNLRNEHGWGAFFTKAKTTLRALTNCQVVLINTDAKKIINVMQIC